MAKAKDWINEEGLKKIAEWAFIGHRDHDLYKFMGITKKTFWQWQTKYPILKETIENERNKPSICVKQALMRKAIGGNVRACIAYLKMFVPERWDEKSRAYKERVSREQINKKSYPCFIDVKDLKKKKK